MTKIYTRTGDKGTTAIYGGERVPKDDIRIEANGTIDELTAVIGVVRSHLIPHHPWQPMFHDMQSMLMQLMSVVVTPSAKRNEQTLPWLTASLDGCRQAIKQCEQNIDRLTATLSDTGFFVMPGGTPISAHLHVARTVARRAERRLWTLHRTDPVPMEVMHYLNRLSDLLYCLARVEMQEHDWPEERFASF